MWITWILLTKRQNCLYLLTIISDILGILEKSDGFTLLIWDNSSRVTSTSIMISSSKGAPVAGNCCCCVEVCSAFIDKPLGLFLSVGLNSFGVDVLVGLISVAVVWLTFFFWRCWLNFMAAWSAPFFTIPCVNVSFSTGNVRSTAGLLFALPPRPPAFPLLPLLLLDEDNPSESFSWLSVDLASDLFLFRRFCGPDWAFTVRGTWHAGRSGKLESSSFSSFKSFFSSFHRDSIPWPLFGTLPSAMTGLHSSCSST